MSDSTSPSASRAHGETRDRILDVAQHLVQTVTFDGFSFRDLAEAVGIRKASVYHHFETKDALAVAVAERARERFRDWAVTQAGRPPMERLEAYCFDLYGARLGAGERLCPGGALVSGWPHVSEDVRRAVTGLMETQTDYLASAIAEGIGDGAIAAPAGRDPRALAKWCVAMVQGALIVARAEGSARTFETLCRTTLDALRGPQG
jgi:TetR/AcrR family transcriptional regulator, transcriptional repressor for nem operon